MSQLSNPSSLKMCFMFLFVHKHPNPRINHDLPPLTLLFIPLSSSLLLYRNCRSVPGSLSMLFARLLSTTWGQPIISPELSIRYMEANLVGTPVYATAIKFVLASYPYLFGSQQGADLRAWCTERNWPLVWFLGVDKNDNSKHIPLGQNHRILDASVGVGIDMVNSQTNHHKMHVRSLNNTIVNVTVSSADIDAIASDWEKISDIRRTGKEKGLSGPSYEEMLPMWKTFSTSVSKLLQLEPLRSYCCAESSSSIGLNADGDCVSSR